MNGGFPSQRPRNEDYVTMLSLLVLHKSVYSHWLRSCSCIYRRKAPVNTNTVHVLTHFTVEGIWNYAISPELCDRPDDGPLLASASLILGWYDVSLDEVECWKKLIGWKCGVL